MGTAETLLNLHFSLAHKGQIEAWQADLKAFEELQADYEDELRRVRVEAYQVATWYAAFQAAIFNAISQASLLTCRLWWCPVSLSVAVSAAAFLAIADKLYSVGKLKEDICETKLTIGETVHWIDVAESEGANLDLETAQPHKEIPRYKLAGCLFIVSWDGFSALLYLTGLSAIIVYFSAWSLCHHCSRCA